VVVPLEEEGCALNQLLTRHDGFLIEEDTKEGSAQGGRHDLALGFTTHLVMGEQRDERKIAKHPTLVSGKVPQEAVACCVVPAKH